MEHDEQVTMENLFVIQEQIDEIVNVMEKLTDFVIKLSVRVKELEKEGGIHNV